MITVTLCISLMVLIIIKYILHIQNIDNYLKNVKTLRRIPFFGSVFLFVGKSLHEICEEVMHTTLRNGTTLKVQLGPSFYVILDEPEDVKTVVTSQHCLDKPYHYHFMPSPYSILSERSGSAWKPIRKPMNTMFSLKRLQSFIPILNEKASILVRELDKEVNKSPFDVMKYLSICTLDSVSSTMMGIDLNTRPNKGIDILASLEKLNEIVTERAQTLWNHLDIIYRWTTLYKKQKKYQAILRQFTNQVFDTKTNGYLSTIRNASPESFEDVQKNSDFPLIPLYVNGKLSEELVKQQIDILLEAAHETTTSAMAYSILLLAMHPNIQEKVFNELHTVHDTQNEEATYDTIQKYEFLDCVIKETMRLFPAAYAFSRTPTADIPLKDYIIPKGVTIILSLYTLHRKRDVWGDNAEQFNPNHFLPEKQQERHPFAYLPFSGGPRNCIGYQYAMFAMRIVLSTILRQYKFSTNLTMKDLKPKFEITLTLLNKHMVRVERRKW